jgi:flavodoxin
MNMQIIYDSVHGRTKTVASKFAHKVQNVHDAKIDSDVVLFICPTYGDEELPHDMEDFLLSLAPDSRHYVVCETGNYYGYDDFQFGASKIIEGHLNHLGWKKFYPSYSLDALPTIDWEPFDEWKRGLENALQNHR